MIRDIISVIVGIIVGMFSIMSLHYLGMIFYPLPEGVNINNLEEISKYISVAPIGSLLFVMFAHIAGTFISGISAALISKNIIPIYIIGGFFTLSGIYNIYILSHPTWFYIEIFLYFPAAIFANKLISRQLGYK